MGALFTGMQECHCHGKQCGDSSKNWTEDCRLIQQSHLALSASGNGQADTEQWPCSHARPSPPTGLSSYSVCASVFWPEEIKLHNGQNHTNFDCDYKWSDIWLNFLLLPSYMSSLELVPKWVIKWKLCHLLPHFDIVVPYSSLWYSCTNGLCSADNARSLLEEPPHIHHKDLGA